MRWGVEASSCATRSRTATGAQPYGPLRRRRISEGSSARAPRRVPLRHVQPHRQHDVDGPDAVALDGEGASPTRSAAARPCDGHGDGHGHDDDLVRLVRNSEDLNPAGTPGARSGPHKAYDLIGYGGTTTLVYNERKQRPCRGLREPQRHRSSTARAASLSPSLLAHRRGDRRGPEATDPNLRFASGTPPVPDAGGPRCERSSPNPAHRSGRFSHEAAAWISEPASSTRLRTRVRVSARASTIYAEQPGSSHERRKSRCSRLTAGRKWTSGKVRPAAARCRSAGRKN